MTSVVARIDVDDETIDGEERITLVYRASFTLFYLTIDNFDLSRETVAESNCNLDN